MQILLLGGTGQVGTEIRKIALSQNVDVVAPSRLALNLLEPESIARIVTARKWTAVINAAAYTDVDLAENEERTAFALNADMPSQLASQTRSRRIPLIHISTNYVFDGRKGAPYVEQDDVAPLNVYGRSKLSGERAVAAGNPRHIIIRTSWIFSQYRKNFVKTILRLAGEQDHLRIVADQRGCPTAACDIADACLAIARRCVLEPERVSYGTYHYTGAGEASWYEFAQTIISLAGKRLAKTCELTPIQTTEYPTPAMRPLDTRLNCEAIIREFDVELRPWPTSLANAIDQLLIKKVMP